MSAIKVDLTCPTCKGAAWLTRDERLERGSEGLACPDCHGGRRRPELHEWDALAADRDFILSMLHSALRVARRLISKRDRYREALERISGQGPEARKAYYDGRGIAGTLPFAQEVARTVLDSEDGETS